MKERVYSSVPVNKLAARVVSKPEFEDDIEYNTINRIHSDSPLPIEQIKVSNPTHILTGKRFGHFVVQGAFPLINSNVNRRWVVKCDCGRYEARTRKCLLRNSDNGNCCVKCLTLKSKILGANERAKYHKRDNDKRIRYKLGYYMGDRRYKKDTNSPYTKRLKVGDLMYNGRGDKGTIAVVSSRSITFERHCFKAGEKVFLDVSEQEAEQRKNGDFRKS